MRPRSLTCSASSHFREHRALAGVPNTMSNGPSPFVAAWSMLYARRLQTPQPMGDISVDHAPLARVLDTLQSEGVRSLSDAASELESYRDILSSIDPDDLTRSESLAYWINLYNAGALHRAGQAYSQDYDSVLRVPGAFSSPWATVAEEAMSLNDIEHGKIRRFGDPRIHGALVCGSVSCPTLRNEPFSGTLLDKQLGDQMHRFLVRGGARLDRTSNTLHLTKVLQWYGGDFVRPQRMPTLRPAGSSSISMAIVPWLEPHDAAYVIVERPRVVYAPYDWGLGCSVA